MFYISCDENKLKLTSASHIASEHLLQSLHPLGVSIKKNLQTAGYQFTVYRTGKKLKASSCCSFSVPIQKHIYRYVFLHAISYVSHVNYPHWVLHFRLNAKCQK